MTDKLPPFGKILRAYHEQRVRLNYPIYVHLGTNANKHCLSDIQNGLMASYLPEGQDVLQYVWPISNQHLVLVDHGDLNDLQIKKIIFHFRTFKPRIIYFQSEIHPSIYFKEQDNE